jgi:DNA-binding MarR family transcriptional regulator
MISTQQRKIASSNKRIEYTYTMPNGRVVNAKATVIYEGITQLKIDYLSYFNDDHTSKMDGSAQRKKFLTLTGKRAELFAEAKRNYNNKSSNALESQLVIFVEQATSRVSRKEKSILQYDEDTLSEFTEEEEEQHDDNNNEAYLTNLKRISAQKKKTFEDERRKQFDAECAKISFHTIDEYNEKTRYIFNAIYSC